MPPVVHSGGGDTQAPAVLGSGYDHPSSLADWFPSSAREICQRLGVSRHPSSRFPRPPHRFWPSGRAINGWFDLSADAKCHWETIFACVTPFLDGPDRTALTLACPGYHPVYGDTFLFPPIPPVRRHFYGCGRDHAAVSTSHDSPSFFILAHFGWKYLTPRDRSLLACASPVFRVYAKLRQAAMTRSIGYLRHVRP